MFKVFGVAVLLALGACGDKTEPTPAPGPSNNAQDGEIGPDGGTVQSDDGRLTLTVPAGALSESFAIRITRRDDSDSPIGVSYDLEPDGLEFAIPASVVWRGPPVEAPPANTLEAVVLQSISDEHGTTWLGDTSTTIDTESGDMTLTGMLDHFSELRADTPLGGVRLTGERDQSVAVVGEPFSLMAEVYASPREDSASVDGLDFSAEITSGAALAVIPGEGNAVTVGGGESAALKPFGFECKSEGEGSYQITGRLVVLPEEGGRINHTLTLPGTISCRAPNPGCTNDMFEGDDTNDSPEQALPVTTNPFHADGKLPRGDVDFYRGEICPGGTLFSRLRANKSLPYKVTIEEGGDPRELEIGATEEIDLSLQQAIDPSPPAGSATYLIEVRGDDSLCEPYTLDVVVIGCERSDVDPDGTNNHTPETAVEFGLDEDAPFHPIEQRREIGPIRVGLDAYLQAPVCPEGVLRVELKRPLGNELEGQINHLAISDVGVGGLEELSFEEEGEGAVFKNFYNPMADESVVAIIKLSVADFDGPLSSTPALEVDLFCPQDRFENTSDTPSRDMVITEETMEGDLTAQVGDDDWTTVEVCAGGTLTVLGSVQSVDSHAIHQGLVLQGKVYSDGTVPTSLRAEGVSGDSGELSLSTTNMSAEVAIYDVLFDVGGERGQFGFYTTNVRVDCPSPNNNSPETALDVDEFVEDDRARFEGIETAEAEEAYFSFSMCADGALTIVSNHVGPGLPPLITLLDSAQQELAEASGGSPTQLHHRFGDTSGQTYFASVRPDGGDAAAEYDVTFLFHCPDASEQNDSEASPRPIDYAVAQSPTGVVLEDHNVQPDDRDLYVVPLGAGCLLRVNAEYDTQENLELEQPLSLSLLGTTLDVGLNYVSAATSPLVGSGGDYIIEVKPTQNGYNLDYTLTVRVLCTGADRLDPANDSIETTPLIDAGVVRTLNGYVADQLESHVADPDIFKVKVCPGDTIEVTLTTAVQSAGLEIDIFLVPGNLLASTSDTGELTLEYSVGEFLSGDEYFVEVSSGAVDMEIMYGITIKVFGGDCSSLGELSCVDGIDNDDLNGTDCADASCSTDLACACIHEAPTLYDGTDLYATGALSLTPSSGDQYTFWFCGGDYTLSATAEGVESVRLTDAGDVPIAEATLEDGQATLQAIDIPPGLYTFTNEGNGWSCDPLQLELVGATGHLTRTTAFLPGPAFSYNFVKSDKHGWYAKFNPRTPDELDCDLFIELTTEDDGSLDRSIRPVNAMDLRLLDDDGEEVLGDLIVLDGGPTGDGRRTTFVQYTGNTAGVDRPTLQIGATGDETCSPLTLRYDFTCEPQCDRDCMLPGCEDDPRCSPSVEDCSNGMDDDGDNNVDCDDDDCAAECCADPMTGEPPGGYETMFFGSASEHLGGGTFCFKDACGNWLNPDGPIMDSRNRSNGNIDLFSTFMSSPVRVPVGIPVDLVKFLASDHVDPTDPDCTTAAGEERTVRLTVPASDGAQGRPIVFLDRTDVLHQFYDECTPNANAQVRVINLSPDVPLVTVTLQPPGFNTEEVDVFVDVPYGQASAYSNFLTEPDDFDVMSGTWRYYDDNFEFQFINSVFGIQETSVMQSPNVGTCSSIIVWEESSTDNAAPLLMVEDPPLCAYWPNFSDTPPPQHLWMDGFSCVFP